LFLEICLLGGIVGVKDGNPDVAVLALPLSFPFLIAADSAGVALKAARAVAAVSFYWWDERGGRVACSWSLPETAALDWHNTGRIDNHDSCNSPALLLLSAPPSSFRPEIAANAGRRSKAYI